MKHWYHYFLGSWLAACYVAYIYCLPVDGELPRGEGQIETILFDDPPSELCGRSRIVGPSKIPDFDLSSPEMSIEDFEARYFLGQDSVNAAGAYELYNMQYNQTHPRK